MNLDAPVEYLLEFVATGHGRCRDDEAVFSFDLVMKEIRALHGNGGHARNVAVPRRQRHLMKLARLYLVASALALNSASLGTALLWHTGRNLSIVDANISRDLRTLPNLKD